MSSNKKHIDRLFQEGFKDFEATPNDVVWENIEKELNKKNKKHRVIPIWWRYAGAAALLLLLLTIGNNIFNTTNNVQKNEVVDTEEHLPSKTNSEKSNSNEHLNNDSLDEKNTLQNKLNETKTVIVNNTKEDINKLKSNNTTHVNNTSNGVSNTKAKVLQHKNKTNAYASSNKKLNNNLALETEEENVIASHIEEKNDAINNNPSLNDTNTLKNNNIIVENTEEENIIISQPKEKKDAINNNETPLININKTNINNASSNNAIAENKETQTIINNNTKENELTIEEALDKNKDIIEEEDKLNRWSVTPNAAPVYFNTLNDKGSSIDPQFNNNSKSGEINMSYGISTSYAVNKKLSIRSGVNRVNLGYNTNNVVVFQSVGLSSSNVSALQNVKVENNNPAVSDVLTNNNDTESFSIISGESLDVQNSPESLNTSNTFINQTLGYIEVPLEIQYSLSNKKLGLNIIGGFSSFFLSDNKIFSEADTETFFDGFEGKATNINKISYSANFGIGFNYKVFNKIDFNLEPMFKYQMNMFNNTSGDFKPYFIGVYTGFAIKF